MENPIAMATRRLLNNRAVFPFWRDAGAGRRIELFGREQWGLLRAAYKDKDFDAVGAQVRSRKGDLERERRQSQGSGGRRGPDPFEPNIRLAEALLSAMGRSAAVVGKLFDLFDSFGSLDTNLPNMEDFGKVAELEPQAMLQQFFLSKIDRARYDRERTALKHVLEEVEYLFAQGSEPVHVGFFLRKLESLKLMPEVICNV